MSDSTFLHVDPAGQGIAACAAKVSSGNVLQLFPAGEFRGWDGRPAEVAAWRIDRDLAERVIARAAAKASAHVIDYEHQTIKAAENGQPAPASGFFRSLEWREGEGLFSTDVEWTARAKAMIDSKEYRYFSPVFRFDKQSGAVTEVLMGALTNYPNLDGMDAVTAAARLFPGAESKEEKRMTLLARLIGALGLSADTDEDKAVAACTALKARVDKADTDIAAARAQAPDPARYVSVETMRDIQAQLAAARSELNEHAVAVLIEPALADGRLLPGDQERWARELGATNVAALKGYLDTAKPIAALKGMQTGGKAPKDADSSPEKLSEDELAVCKAMGLDVNDFAAAKAA